MLFAVRFKDKEGMFESRQENLTKHIAWLDQHQNTILVGGSLRESPDQVPIGGLWIVEASSRDHIMALIQSDPFWQIGLRESVEILHWSKAFEDRKVLI